MKKPRLAVIFISFLLLTIYFTSFAYCDSFCSAVIEGSFSTDVKAEDEPKNIFVLEGMDGSPMPYGTEKGQKRTEVSGTSDFSFGEIAFARPGTYMYRVFRETDDEKNITEDRSVYIVRVDVFSDASSVYSFEKEGEKGKCDGIVYSDKIIPGVRSVPVKTGDETSSLIYVLLIIAALIGLIMCRFFISDKKR